jgi:hypothetical protein
MSFPLARQQSASFGCQDILTQIFGARPARSNTGVFSTSSGAAPKAVSSVACRNASVVESRPSTVSLAWLPESCGRAGTRSPVSSVFGSRLLCVMVTSSNRPIHSLASRSAGQCPFSCNLGGARSHPTAARFSHCPISELVALIAMTFPNDKNGVRVNPLLVSKEPAQRSGGLPTLSPFR